MRRGNLIRSVATLAVIATLATSLTALPSGATSPTILTAKSVFPSSLAPNVPLVRLQFNHPVSVGELPHVTSAPALAIKWQQIGGREVQAVTTSTLVPDTQYLLSVPVRVSCTSYCVTVTRVKHTSTASASELWLQELLATLNYLPVSFSPTVPTGKKYAFVPGTFTWKYPKMPTEFKQMWVTGQNTLIVIAAIKRFQSEHNMGATGVMDAPTWAALIGDAHHYRVNATPYDYVYVDKTLPEHLDLYRNGKVIFSTYVNTGIAAAPTEAGTFSVYARFITTTMSGTNPDGTKYSDPGIPWVSYFNGGDALHGFIRSSYGWPQSLGCVEMPFADAAVVFKYTPIGTLVTVN